MHWTDDALADVDRIFDFLVIKNEHAAERTVRTLLSAPNVLAENPFLGPVVEKFEKDNVRRLIVGAYEVRYRPAGQTVEILRVFHTKEDR
jgi:plasmid stabilization system protein ParE